MMQRKGAGRGLRPRPAALLCSHRQRPAAPAPALHSTERGAAAVASRSGATPGPAPKGARARIPPPRKTYILYHLGQRLSARPKRQAPPGYKICVLRRSTSRRAQPPLWGPGRGLCFALGSRCSFSHAAPCATNHRVVEAGSMGKALRKARRASLRSPGRSPRGWRQLGRALAMVLSRPATQAANRPAFG